jgi:nicotinamidase-related amidase
MDVMLVVDMQVGLLNGMPKHDLQGVIDRINRLSAMVRGRSGRVVWIQHGGPAGDDFEPGTPGWSFLPDLDRQPDDVTVPKTLNDAFAGTGLAKLLDGLAPRRLLIGGWATDFCVDATVRSAASRDYDVIVAADGHTLSDRPHLDAPGVIRHHNWVWANLIARRSVRVSPAAELL